MRMILLSFVLTLMCVSANAQQLSHEQRAQFQKEHDEIVAMFRTETNYHEVDRPDVLQFIDRKNSRVFLVTKPGHPAHPAVVTRQAIEDKGQLFVKSKGIGKGDQEVLKTWVDYLNAEDRKAIEQKRQESSK
jgi:hypothetical protein